MTLSVRSKIILLVGVVCMLAAGQVWLSHLRVGLTQDVVKLKQDKNKLEQDVQSLRLEFMSLTRLDTLRRLAREKFGMQAPSSMQVLEP